MGFLFSIVFCLLHVAVFVKGVCAQEDPWPPLVTTCDIMPLVAADANYLASDILACSSSARPVCNTIYCEVLSNKDQLELELLPCGGGILIENRALGGKVLYQDVFTSSRIATAYIGGQNVELNVTIVQRGVTVGFTLWVTMAGSNPRTILPYRDIPLNITQCGQEYPLLCKMILYMEQYIITSHSARSGDPNAVPQCQPPDTKSCDRMLCSWSNAAMVNHSYQFMRCAKPQAFRLVMTSKDYVWFDETFDRSKFVPGSGTDVNVTIMHGTTGQSFGFQVDFIGSSGRVTEIPYTILPLETNGCPPPPEPRLSGHSMHHGTV